MSTIQNLNKALAGNYELIFPLIPVVDKPKDMDIFSLNIHGTVIPSMTVGTSEPSWQNASFPIAIAPTTFDPWFVNFTVDSDFCNWYILYKWILFMNDPMTGIAHSHKEYAVDAVLKFINNDNKEVMNIKIYNIYPTLLNEVQLTHRNGEEILDCGVNFNYTAFETQRL